MSPATELAIAVSGGGLATAGTMVAIAVGVAHAEVQG